MRVDKEIVNQHPHRHAALCRAQQLFGGEDADVVSTPDEILHVDGLSGVLRQPRSAYQCFFAFFEYVDAGLRLHTFRASGATAVNPLGN